MKLSKGSLFVSILLIAVAFLIYALINIDQIIQSIVFRPTLLPENHIYQFNRPYCQFYIYTSDGMRLDVIHFRSVKPEGALLYFHGNKDNLDRWGQIAGSLVDFGWDVFVVDYRGYGKSNGVPDERGLYLDASSLYNNITTQYSYKKFIFYGRSLGSGVAAWLAGQYNPTGLILETPYYSLESIITRYFPFYDAISDQPIKIKTHQFIKSVATKILILHGTDDALIPVEYARKLFNEIECTNKELLIIPGGTHDNLPETREYKTALHDFFNELQAGNLPSQNLH